MDGPHENVKLSFVLGKDQYADGPFNSKLTFNFMKNGETVKKATVSGKDRWDNSEGCLTKIILLGNSKFQVDPIPGHLG